MVVLWSKIFIKRVHKNHFVMYIFAVYIVLWRIFFISHTYICMTVLRIFLGQGWSWWCIFSSHVTICMCVLFNRYKKKLWGKNPIIKIIINNVDWAFQKQILHTSNEALTNYPDTNCKNTGKVSIRIPTLQHPVWTSRNISID